MPIRLDKRDKEFHLRKITYVDYKLVEMDRVLTMLFPRLKFGGRTSRRQGLKDLRLETFIDEFLSHDRKIIDTANEVLADRGRHQSFQTSRHLNPDDFPELSLRELNTLHQLLNELDTATQGLSYWFDGLHNFAESREVLRKWIETDLMDVVNRGKPNQAIAAPRPLHGNTYKFRNAKHTRDYGAAEQIYWMLAAARRGRGQAALDALRRFFFSGVDSITDKFDPQVELDVETQALLHLDQQITRDLADSKEPEKYLPLCIGQADLMADDVLRLLAYQSHMPRSVLVDYLKILLAFHLALYHLKLFKILPDVVNRRSVNPGCRLSNCVADNSNRDAPFHACPYRLGLLVEMGDVKNARMIELATQSWDIHQRRITGYIQSHLSIKKLDEMAASLNKMGRLPLPASGYFSVENLLELLQSKHSAERDAYFKSRLLALMDAFTDEGDLPPEIKRIIELDLNDFDTFIEILVALRGRFHRDYITQGLDAFCLKNSDAGILRQPRIRGGGRYLSLGSRLLEVLLQIAVLAPTATGFETRQVRVEELLDFLRTRYGIYVDRLPMEEGFGKPSILDQEALRRNAESFKVRLREIGYFRDLSDAYFTQTITSRYTIS